MFFDLRALSRKQFKFHSVLTRSALSSCRFRNLKTVIFVKNSSSDIRIIFFYRYISSKPKSTHPQSNVFFSSGRKYTFHNKQLFVTFSVRDVTSFGIASSLTNYTSFGQKEKFYMERILLKGDSLL